MLTGEVSLHDGINRHILTISAELVRQGMDVAVCTVRSEGDGDLPQELRKAGVTVYSLGGRNGHDLRIVPRFIKVMRLFRPDVIHGHVTAFLERVVLCFGFDHVARVATVHGTGYFPDGRLRFRWLTNRLVSLVFPMRYAMVCYVSDGVRDVCGNQFGGVCARTIYNPIKCDVECGERRLRKELGLKENVKIVGTACRIADVKNPLAFTRVMRKALEAFPAAHAVVIGDGDKNLYAAMYEVARGCEQIHFMGYRNDARALLAECDVCVITSHTEGMPTVLLEAMASGVPVAFWRGGGGLVDLERINSIDGPIGVVANQGDEDNLASGISDILSGRMSISKGRLREITEKYFSVENVARELVEVYESVCTSRH